MFVRFRQFQAILLPKVPELEQQRAIFFEYVVWCSLTCVSFFRIYINRCRGCMKSTSDLHFCMFAFSLTRALACDASRPKLGKLETMLMFWTVSFCLEYQIVTKCDFVWKQPKLIYEIDKTKCWQIVVMLWHMCIQSLRGVLVSYQIQPVGQFQQIQTNRQYWPRPWTSISSRHCPSSCGFKSWIHGKQNLTRNKQ